MWLQNKSCNWKGKCIRLFWWFSSENFNHWLTDDWVIQFGRICRKIQNGLWPPPPRRCFGKLWYKFFWIFVTKITINILSKICGFLEQTFSEIHPNWKTQSSLKQISLHLVLTWELFRLKTIPKLSLGTWS